MTKKYNMNWIQTLDLKELVDRQGQIIKTLNLTVEYAFQLEAYI